MANILEALQALSQLPQVTGQSPQLSTIGMPTPEQLPPPMSLQIPQPMAPPPAPSAPIDQEIISRYLALLPPAPAAPPQPSRPSTLGRIATALQAFSAGVQGQGPQFLANLQAERDRPQREYEAKKQQYDQTRAQFGLRGLEAAQGQADRQTAQTQAAADRQFERELQERARRMGFDDQIAIEKLREAMTTQRDKEKERAADEKQSALFDQQIKIEKGKLRKGFLDQGAGKYADELASYALGQTDSLSPGAEKANLTIQAKIAALQRRAAGSGGGGGGRSSAEKVMTWAELSDGNIIPARDAKIEQLPAGVQVKRLFATGLPGQGAQPGGAADLDGKVKAAIANGVPAAQIIAAIRQDAPQQAEALIKKYNLNAAPQAAAPVAAPSIQGARPPAQLGSPERPLIPALGNAIKNLLKNNPNVAAPTQQYGAGNREPVK